jgi:hypothetical protein
MVRSISTPPEVSTTFFQPSVSNLPNKDLHYGVSTLTIGSAAKNSVIVLGILGVGALLGAGALLVVLWRKLFAARSVPIPTKIQEWVKQNCKDLNAKHQWAVSSAIVRTKRKMELTTKRDVSEIFDLLARANPVPLGLGQPRVSL